MPPCQAQENWTAPPISPKIKGNPGPCGNRNRGWHGAVCAPVHGYRISKRFSAPYQLLLIRGQPYLGPGIAPQKQGDEYQQHDNQPSHAAPPRRICAVPGARNDGGSHAEPKLSQAQPGVYQGTTFIHRDGGLGASAPRTAIQTRAWPHALETDHFRKRPERVSVRGLFLSHGLRKRFLASR